MVKTTDTATNTVKKDIRPEGVSFVSAIYFSKPATSTSMSVRVAIVLVCLMGAGK
jgi:hypothetical protein